MEAILGLVASAAVRPVDLLFVRRSADGTLASMRSQGVLSDDEFAAAMATLPG
ncbi:hypothetical protein LLS1_06100 [Leifsonia sp. LS1]|uniref:hypothetical protein n=1 Tax=Leifsonia sp. LS1 TaxID=2828483 RepID=UPI001CFD7B04|nr:hypothetical protein [Leifsonia sp. LS1]GIT78941.1 hypothetical protein LLS1_06100 [Leifsonia sp. LS1]